MGEINHNCVAEIVKSYFQYAVPIDQNLLLNFIEKVKKLNINLSKIKQKFDEIYKISFQKLIEQRPKEDMSQEVQRIIACTTTATQQNTENDATSKENIKFVEQLKEEITEKLENIDLTKQGMTDDMPSEVDDEMSEMKDIKYLQFVEIMYQNEIKSVFEQLHDHGKRYTSIRYMNGEADFRVRLAIIEEYFIHRIDLINKLLYLEEKVLKLKLYRKRMPTNVEAIGIEMTNVSSKIDDERSKLIRDNTYLCFIFKMHRKDINRIFTQLQLYCYRYNMPDEEVKIMMHKDFIMQKIEKIKEDLELKEEVMDFNLQIEREAANVETNDAETTNMSSMVESIKSMLMKNNKYLRYIVMKYQNEINRVYAELQMYCDTYNSAIEQGVIIVGHPNVKTDCAEKTNISNKIDEKSKLRTSYETFRSVEVMLQEVSVSIYDQLKMYLGKYDMPNENVTIVMHTKPYDPTTTHDDENELMKDNEYLAFIAMMHLKKLEDVCAFFKMHFNGFNKTIEEVTEDNRYMDQINYMSYQISVLDRDVFMLNHDWEIIENFYKYNE